MAINTGFFVDWNGTTRRVEAPGDGYTCQVVDRGHQGVDVIDSAGFVCHEATYFHTLADIEAAGVVVSEGIDLGQQRGDPVDLGKMLGLRPLDRLQINDAHENRERLSWIRMGHQQDCELPFYYFQRILADGRLEVCSPGGYLTAIDPTDACDIFRGEPVMVRAMPKSIFIERLKLTIQERNLPLGPESYADAYVMCVEKDRWSRVDRVFVSFVDPSLNQGERFSAPIHPEDRQRLNALARRTLMPVVTPKHGAGYSADHGVARQQAIHKATVNALFHCALTSDQNGIQTLAAVGIKPLKQSALNRLCH